jgi:hypothetical protein
MYGACHWLVNFNLKLAMLVEPEKPWRIVTSDKHSTVWDGAHTLFEFNFLAFGIPAQECIDLALQDGTILPLGQNRQTHPAIGFPERTPSEISSAMLNEITGNTVNSRSETCNVHAISAFLKHDAPLVQTHLEASRGEHTKVVNTVAAWTTLIYGAPDNPHLNDEIANNLVEGFGIDIDTIRALKNGLNMMIELEHEVEFDPWFAFERLGIDADLRIQTSRT